MGGAAVGGGIPGASAQSMSVVPEGDLQVSFSYRYSYGDTYFRESEQAESGLVQYYRVHFLDVYGGYGLTEDLTIDAGLGLFPLKLQQFPDYQIRGTGISHLDIGARYLLAGGDWDSHEWSVGMYGRIPLERSSDNLPQHISPSTGAAALIASTRISIDVHQGRHFIVFTQTGQYQDVNSSSYRYGPSFTTSIGGIWSASETIVTRTDVRGEIYLRDSFFGDRLADTGRFTVSLTQSIGIRVGNMIFAPYLDYPIYQQYNGHQLANDLSAGLNVIWNAISSD
ncbi:MAG: hypothetical protein KFF77_01060 [Bacteroidetes bacterium]|nr:hypothetical protein [Bacteroidota bacterium]